MARPTLLSSEFLRYSSIGLLFMISTALMSQNADSILLDTGRVVDPEIEKHSPTKASLFSAALPGLGQAYNKKYWKIPLVYIAMGIPLYYGLEQHGFYKEKYNAYKQRLNGDSTDVFLMRGNFFTNEGLLKSLDINRRNRDLMYIVTGVMYLLQIVDATVDAHLFYFNVSDDLSLRYEPFMYFARRENTTIQGVSLSFYF